MNKVLHGDNIAIIPTLEDKSVRAVITSPPYGMQRVDQYGGILEAEYPAWTVGWMNACLPKMKDDGSIFIVIRPHIHNGELSDYVLRTRLAVRDAGWIECEELIWYKPDAPPLGSIVRPRRVWESILWFSRSRQPFVNLKATGKKSSRVGGFFGSQRFGTGDGMPVHAGQKSNVVNGTSRCTDVIEATISSLEAGVPHPAQYPLGLTSALVRSYSEPGDLILDPFSGSGTTCCSAKTNGRRYVGIERDPAYVEFARGRLDKINPMF